jgi:hypothetical protein
MPTVFPGWYIEVTRKSFLSKAWEVRFHDGRHSAELRITSYKTKRGAENFAQVLLEVTCKDWLEELKHKQPDLFKKILSDPRFVWRTNGPMGDIPIGRIAQKLYPEATKAAKG